MSYHEELCATTPSSTQKNDGQTIVQNQQKSRLFDPALGNRFNHTSLVAVVTQTDRPKSVHNRCVIEVFGGVFCVALFGFFCVCRGFCHRTESDLFLFSLTYLCMWQYLNLSILTLCALWTGVPRASGLTLTLMTHKGPCYSTRP